MTLCDTFHKDRFYRLTEKKELTIKIWERIQRGLSHSDHRLLTTSAPSLLGR